MRTRNVPSPWRAKSQLKSAVRALPTCSSPLGAGENRTRSVISATSLVLRAVAKTAYGSAAARPPLRSGLDVFLGSPGERRSSKVGVGDDLVGRLAHLGVRVGRGGDAGAHDAQLLRQLLEREAQQRA